MLRLLPTVLRFLRLPFVEARAKERFPSERRQNPVPVRALFVVSFRKRPRRLVPSREPRPVAVRFRVRGNQSPLQSFRNGFQKTVEARTEFPKRVFARRLPPLFFPEAEHWRFVQVPRFLPAKANRANRQRPQRLRERFAVPKFPELSAERRFPLLLRKAPVLLPANFQAKAAIPILAPREREPLPERDEPLNRAKRQYRPPHYRRLQPLFYFLPKRKRERFPAAKEQSRSRRVVCFPLRPAAEAVLFPRVLHRLLRPVSICFWQIRDRFRATLFFSELPTAFVQK